MMRPQLPWVSLEGVNGVGKTRLAQNVSATLGDGCVCLSELPDAAAGTLPAAVIAALRGHGDLFMRTGSPLTEMMLLSALQVHRWESLAASPPARLVLEDRGPYSVAVYQAAIFAGDGDSVTMAMRILDLIAGWRPLPTITLLLRDDPDRCLRQFEQRIDRSASSDERQLMARASDLYLQMAAAAPGGVTVIDRTGLSEQEATAIVLDACHRAAGTAIAAKGRKCADVP